MEEEEEIKTPQEQPPKATIISAILEEAYLFLLDMLQFVVTAYVLYDIYNLFIPDYFDVKPISFTIAIVFVLFRQLVLKNSVENIDVVKNIILIWLAGLRPVTKIQRGFINIISDLILLLAAHLIKDL